MREYLYQHIYHKKYKDNNLSNNLFSQCISSNVYMPFWEDFLYNMCMRKSFRAFNVKHAIKLSQLKIDVINLISLYISFYNILKSLF